jgi:magnesium chelatase subunit D
MPGRSGTNRDGRGRARPAFPFAAIVGQEEMKLALLLNVIAPSVGGVLVMGHRGTGKSTAVRALAELLPPLKAVAGCPFGCDPDDPSELCADCRARAAAGARLRAERRAVAVVDLPLGATEDRVCGAIDLGRAVREGVRAFEPGLLARAHRGFLYVDEVNLLEDHLVDLLLDVAATGVNRVEREGVSVEHPARFVLVGSGNPEEGELRPQLLDRFGLCVEVETERDVERRVRIVEQREAFERDPEAFNESLRAEQDALRRRVSRARRAYARTELPRALLRSIAELCLRLNVDGHRGELTVARAARALAAFEGRKRVTADDVRRVTAMSLRHRLRRDPFEQTSGGSRVDELTDELFGDDTPGGNGHRPRPLEENVRGRAEEKIFPPADARLSAEGFAEAVDGATHGRGPTFVSRRRAGARRSTSTTRGRHAGAAEHAGDGPRRLALDATLRAAARNSTGSFKISLADVRFKRFRAKAGTLYVFAVDTSGSMALNRIGAAKGALAGLLRRSYVRRDRVALVTFRGADAETVLRPCGSPALARRHLDALPVGGATPLAAGLQRALEIARRARAAGASDIRLVLFTDGRANVSAGSGPTDDARARRLQLDAELSRLGVALRAEGVAATVVDTAQRFTSRGEARALSATLGGAYVQM